MFLALAGPWGGSQGSVADCNHFRKCSDLPVGRRPRPRPHGTGHKCSSRAGRLPRGTEPDCALRKGPSWSRCPTSLPRYSSIFFPTGRQAAASPRDSRTRGWPHKNATEIYFRAAPEAKSPRSRCPQGWLPLRPLSLAGGGCWADGRLLSVSTVCTRVCALTASSSKDGGRVGFGPTRMASFYINYLFKGLPSKFSSVSMYQGLCLGWRLG